MATGERLKPRTTELLSVDLIDIRSGRRPLDMTTVNAMAASMQAIGLRTPISVRYHPLRPDDLPPNGIDEAFVLITGRHRLAAAQKLGWTQIESFVFDEGSPLDAELWEIDENLARAELSPSQRAEQIARRKAIYLELHPETGHGTPGVSRQVGDTRDRVEAERFTAETASLIGRSERSVQRDAERGEKVIDEVMDLIRGTALDTGTYLDKLKKLTPNDQVTAAKRDLAAPRPDRSRSPRPQANTAKPFEWFLTVSELMPMVSVDELVADSGSRRAVLGQRASGLIDYLTAVLEAID